MRSRFLITAATVAVLVGCTDEGTITAIDQDLTVAEAPKGPALGSGGEYEVTVENLIETEGQWFTPALVALHQNAEDFFTLGKPASERLMGLAENGGVPPFAASLESSPHVSASAVVFGADGPLAPGESASIFLTADPGSNFVSFASMLICTNDGFTGVDGAKLPNRLGETIEIYAAAYDAGTEINTENFADIVPPCQDLGGIFGDPGTGMSNPLLAEDGVIHYHPGIMGGYDLVPETHGWMELEYVAKFTVTRIG